MSYGNFCLVSDIDECASVVEDKAIVLEKTKYLEFVIYPNKVIKLLKRR